MPLLDIDGEVLGHLAVLDRKPLREDPRCLAVFQMVAARPASELARRRAIGSMSVSREDVRESPDAEAPRGRDPG